MATAGYCRECGYVVWLNEAGGGTCGHPASEITGVFEAGEPIEPAGRSSVSPPFTVGPATLAAPVTGIEEAQGGSAISRFVRTHERSVPVLVALLVLLSLVIVLYPRPRFALVKLTAPEVVVQGEEFVFSLELQNRGWRRGDRAIVLLVGDEVVGSAVVIVAARDSEQVEIPVRADWNPGRQELRVADWGGPAPFIEVLPPES